MASVTGEVLLPKLGESIQSATVVRWLKKVGDEVSQDEPIVEVATDKVNSEIPAPFSGMISQILVQEGEEVPVGAKIATIGGEVQKPFISPAVKSLMKMKGMSQGDLSQVEGSGKSGRVTKKDIQIVEKKSVHSTRKAIADHMVKSHLEIPQAALFTDVDVTDLMLYIQKEKVGFAKQHGVKLTVTSFLVQAMAEALATFPDLNGVYENDAITMRDQISIGIATDTREGLLVPVIHTASKKPLVHLARDLSDLKKKAISKTLKPDDVSGATATLSNFGASGIAGGIPIVPHRQSVILGVGSVRKTVCATEENAIVIRDMITLTLSFDHRVADGMYACGFLKKIESYLTRDLER